MYFPTIKTNRNLTAGYASRRLAYLKMTAASPAERNSAARSAIFRAFEPAAPRVQHRQRQHVDKNTFDTSIETELIK